MDIFFNHLLIRVIQIGQFMKAPTALVALDMSSNQLGIMVVAILPATVAAPQEVVHQEVGPTLV